MTIQRTCRCGRVQEHRVGTTEFFIHEMKIQLHNVPHYHCIFCESNSYDGETDVVPLIKTAYKLKLKNVNWEDRDKPIIVVFNVNVSDDLKEEITGIIYDRIIEIRREEHFLVVAGKTMVIGTHVANYVHVELILEKKAEE